MQEQEEILRRQFHQTSATDDNKDLLPTLKVTWQAESNDPTNGGYSKESLSDLFSQVCVYLKCVCVFLYVHTVCITV